MSKKDENKETTKSPSKPKAATKKTTETQNELKTAPKRPAKTPRKPKTATKKPTPKETTKEKPADKNPENKPKEQKQQPPIDDKNVILESHDFSNDAISLKVDVKKNCRIEFLTSIKDKARAEAQKKALKSVKKEVSIPGFRKGKAPDSLIKTQYVAALKEREEKELIDVAFFESIKLSKYTPFDPKKSKFNGYNEDKSALKFEIESYPKMPDLDFDSLSLVEVRKKEVIDEDYQEAISKLQNMYAEQKEINDRNVQEGDFVLVDVEDLDSEKAEKVFSNTRFEVSDAKISDWMKDAILGKKIKEQIETVSKPDNDASDDEKKEFKEKKVRVTINQIQSNSLPALDDEFAKKYQLSTIKELEQRVRECLDKKFKKECQKEMREAIGKQLKEIEIQIPASILEQESNHRITQMFQDTKFKAEWSKMSDDEKDAKKNEVVKEAQESLILMFITQKIIAENKLKINESNVQTEPDPIQMAVDFDPMMFFKPTTPEQKNMDYSMRSIHTAEDFVIETLQNKSKNT